MYFAFSSFIIDLEFDPTTKGFTVPTVSVIYLSSYYVFQLNFGLF